MQMTGNTILITGGGSGIGRGLAEAFLQLGNEVIIAGRRKQVLDETTAANPGMKSKVLDIESAEAIASFAAELVREFPSLNAVIHNAGMMRFEDVKTAGVADAEATITTNLLGPIRLTAALMPQLLAQPNAAILTVTSGLAFVPMALTPTYSATKAALHSYTQSLRYQLQGTGIQVIELPPPYVQTTLMGPGQAQDPRAMPLVDYIAETMSLLKNSPDVPEILVERVHPLRFAEKNGSFDQVFKGMNDAMSAPRK
jgi:uncharacterized oxidoreductase